MKRKMIIILLSGVLAMSLAACSSNQSTGTKKEGDLTFSASEETNDDGTVFTIETNLPDGTLLTLLLNGDTCTEEKQVSVEEGKAVSETFSDDGEPLKGDFSLTVVLVEPSKQPAEVQKMIGSNGEKLTGELVTKYTFGESSAKETFDFSF